MILLALTLIAAVSMCAGWWLREWELRADRPPRIVERSSVRFVDGRGGDCDRPVRVPSSRGASVNRPVDWSEEGWV